MLCDRCRGDVDARGVKVVLREAPGGETKV